MLYGQDVGHPARLRALPQPLALALALEDSSCQE
jgi:hypothetical protein